MNVTAFKPPTCSGSQANIGPALACVYALKGYPLAEADVLFNMILSSIGYPILLFVLVNRMLHVIEQSKFQKKPIIPLMFVAMIVKLAFGVLAFFLRIADWVKMSKDGYRFYTIDFAITQSLNFVAIGFLVMNYVDRHLIQRDQLKVLKEYTILTKVICGLFIVTAVGQGIFYAAVTVIHEGKKPQYVKDTQIYTLSVQCLIMLVASFMFIVGIAVYRDDRFTTKNRYSVDCSMVWAFGTIVIAGFNIFVIKFYHLDKHVVSPELGPTFTLVVSQQLSLAPFIKTTTLILISSLAQFTINLYLLGIKYNGFFGLSIVRWLSYCCTGKYHGKSKEAMTDNSTKSDTTSSTATPKRRTDFSVKSSSRNSAVEMTTLGD